MMPAEWPFQRWTMWTMWWRGISILEPRATVDETFRFSRHFKELWFQLHFISMNLELRLLTKSTHLSLIRCKNLLLNLKIIESNYTERSKHFSNRSMLFSCTWALFYVASIFLWKISRPWIECFAKSELVSQLAPEKAGRHDWAHDSLPQRFKLMWSKMLA